MAVNPKLMALPIDALFKLKQDIDAAVERRRYELFRPGRLATFQTSKGRMGPRSVTVRITGLGPKNVTAEEVNERGNPTGMKWRIAPSLLTPVFEQPKPAVPPKGAGADAPQSMEAGSF